MDDKQPTHDDFLQLCQDISTKYDVIYNPDAHDSFRIFYIDGIEAFRLVFEKKPSGETFIYLAFHLNMDNVETIRWYIRIVNLCQEVTLVESYYLDEDKSPRFGDDAYELRDKAIKKEVLEEYSRQVSEQLDNIQDITDTPNDDLLRALEEMRTMKKPNRGDLHK